MLAVSVDPPEMNRRLAERLGLTFPLLTDHSLEAMDRFGLRHEAGGRAGQDIFRPAVFILDETGRIVWRKLTDDWRVRVRPEEILKELQAME